ncbi:molybdopterin-binding oxidoreductase, partial [Streptomyces sp. NPDC059153]
MIAGFCALAVAELVAAVVRPEAGPVTAVGSAVIDRTPPAVRDFAVRNFGTADKLVLQLGILILLALFAMTVGVLALRHRRLGSAAVLVFGLVGAVAAAGRPEGAPADALPSVVGAAVAVGVLYLLVGRLTPALGATPRAGGVWARWRAVGVTGGGGGGGRPAP